MLRKQLQKVDAERAAVEGRKIMKEQLQREERCREREAVEEKEASERATIEGRELLKEHLQSVPCPGFE
jgi:hypothetical protein